MFGLINVYNRLPEHIVQCDTIKDFQHELQLQVKTRLELDHNDVDAFSLYSHRGGFARA